MLKPTETAIVHVGWTKKMPIKKTVEPKYNGCLTRVYKPVVTKPEDSELAEKPKKADKLMFLKANFSNPRLTTTKPQPMPKVKYVRSNIFSDGILRS